MRIANLCKSLETSLTFQESQIVQMTYSTLFSKFTECEYSGVKVQLIHNFCCRKVVPKLHYSSPACWSQPAMLQNLLIYVLVSSHRSSGLLISFPGWSSKRAPVSQVGWLLAALAWDGVSLDAVQSVQESEEHAGSWWQVPSTWGSKVRQMSSWRPLKEPQVQDSWCWSSDDRQGTGLKNAAAALAG